jgi:Arm DNA-binding domain/Phage integrase central domain
VNYQPLFHNYFLYTFAAVRYNSTQFCGSFCGIERMVRTLNRLTARAVATAAKPGLYTDGGGLYLRVGRGGAKNWALRFMLEGKAREMGLGAFSKVSLADARKRASAARLLLVDRIDPIDRRKAEYAAKRVEGARSMTFDQCADAYIRAHEASWRHAKHHQQWTNSLARHVSPVFGSVPVANVDVSMVMKAIEPVWATKPETAQDPRAG